jgi:TatD DNase family protein
MLTDSHTHLDHEYFHTDRAQVIDRALANEVSRIINIGFNRATIETTLELAQTYDMIDAVIGWHPQEAIHMTSDDLDYIEQLARSHPKVVALGEMGLDYYWDTSPKETQQRIFREQLRLARKLNLPVVIHNRDAHADVVRILQEEKAFDIGGVMHCFSGSWEVAKQCLEMNFYISFGGPITFVNAKQPKEVLKNVPIERVLIETDAPYLSPHPYRGKRNEIEKLKIIAEVAAEIKGLEFKNFATLTTHNASELFKKNKGKLSK